MASYFLAGGDTFFGIGGMSFLRTVISGLLVIVCWSGCAERSERPESRAAKPPATNRGAEPGNPLPDASLPVRWKALQPAAGGKGHQFQRLDAARTGVDFLVPIDNSHPLKRLYVGGFFCGGVAIGDVDGDGAADLYLISGPGPNRLFRQVGDFRFEDITSRAGVDGGDAWGTGAAMVDIDNDGDLDIYLCNYDSPNQLLINQGDATFVPRGQGSGLDIVDSSLMPTFCDYDRDGDLDCYLMTNRYYRAGGLPKDMKLITRGGRLYLPKQYQKYYTIRTTGKNRGELSFAGRPDHLLRNNGDGTFSDVTESAGLSTAPGHALSATWWDFDADGWHDLYASNDFDDPDHLYRNNADGTFTDVILQSVPHTPWFSMGSDVGDINNDGWFDFLIADMEPTTHFGRKTTMEAVVKHKWFLETSRPLQYMRNAFYLNTGTARFMEIAHLCGLASTDWTWTVRFADLDNDGWLDLFLSNGMTRNLNDTDRPFTVAHQMGRDKWQLYENLPPMPEQNLAFRNRGDFRFTDVSHAWGLDQVGMSFAAAVGDLDRDGDLDLVVANLDEPVSMFRNQSTDGHRVLIELRGTRSNRRGIGAVVSIETTAGRQVRQLIPTTGYVTSNEPVVHFGLGDVARIRRLTINWPSGHRQTLEDLPADRQYTITEPDGPPGKPAPVVTRPTMFRSSDVLAEARHRETPFDDYKRQPLLPFKLSQLGPGVACGDVDGDGDDDLYLGGAAGQSGTLCLHQHGGHFTLDRQTVFGHHSACEDMAPLLLDVDGDGDLDLYVSSGGVECRPGEGVLQDRLYLNDGQGHFTHAPAGSLPALRDSASAVVAGDLDRDGDLDLFVGGRVIPGQYPLTPRSHLLRNDGGRFVDVTDQLAPGLARTGLVTGAIWSDATGDGWLDLLVTHQWGPVKLWTNVHGHLVDRTEQAGLSQWQGWFNGIAGRDLNGDGHIDYVVTNFGLNTKYRATPREPALLYYGDFEGLGRMRLVEVEHEHGKLYPLRGRTDSTAAMPFLKRKFTTYKSFARATLEEVYTASAVRKAHRYVATTLESGVLLNDGTGQLQFSPLPRLAQVSPGFGVVLTEVDGDGHADAYVVQNFFSPQLETGRMDGGLSLLLKGKGDGSFLPVWPARSGLSVPGDAKGLVVSDLNGDRWPDFVVGINNDALVAFEHLGLGQGQLLTVRLRGPRGNPTAVGARVTVHLTGGTSQTAEVYAGGGYLSQSTARLTFGLGSSGQVDRIEVDWPDGSHSQHQVAPDERDAVIRFPQRAGPPE